MWYAGTILGPPRRSGPSLAFESTNLIGEERHGRLVHIADVNIAERRAMVFVQVFEDRRKDRWHRAVDRVAEDTRRNRRKRDAREAVLVRQRQRAPHRACQQPLFASRAALPDRSYRVDDVARLEVPAAGDGGTAGWHAAMMLDPATALARDLGAALPGDRAGHAAAVGEHLVRG